MTATDPRSVQETRTTPDPSVLTTAQSLERAAAERTYTDGQIAVLAERILRLIQRMDDRDEATKVLHETVTRVPTEMQLAIGHLGAVVDEKFASVNTRFTLNDDRQKAEAVANETKVNAAFAAQKEAAAEQNKANQTAINKSEEATKESIAKLAELVKTGMDALSDKIDDGKDHRTRIEDRLTRHESAALGSKDQRTEGRDQSRAIYAFGGFIISLVLVAIAIIGFVEAVKK